MSFCLARRSTLGGKSPEIVKAVNRLGSGAQRRGSTLRRSRCALRLLPDHSVQMITPARVIVGVTKQLLDDARAHDVKIEEFLPDFDCAQKNLGVIERGCSP